MSNCLQLQTARNKNLKMSRRLLWEWQRNISTKYATWIEIFWGKLVDPKKVLISQQLLAPICRSTGLNWPQNLAQDRLQELAGVGANQN